MKKVLAIWVAWWACAGVAFASPVEEAQRAELERLRQKLANQIHLAAFDLIDEVVYGWNQEPVFSQPTPVVVASVTVPVGLGSGLQAQLENHLSMVIGANPSSNVKLVHCPTCTQVLVQSGPTSTIVSRGIDNPEVWAELSQVDNQHALFVDVEAEGTFLVLRARLTRLDRELPIVWSRTLSTTSDSASLLRSPERLTSAAEAREEYLDSLTGDSQLSVPLRFSLRSYAPSSNRNATPAPPFIWLQSGIEIGASSARDWTASVLLGATFIPQAYQGLMAQGRVNRLLSGRVRSLNHPDLYAFVGGAVITVWGPATGSFSNERVTADDIINFRDGNAPRASFGTVQLGLDLRVGNRIGISGFLEWIPQFNESPNLGSYIRIGPLEIQSFASEVSFWF